MPLARLDLLPACKHGCTDHQSRLQLVCSRLCTEQVLCLYPSAVQETVLVGAAVLPLTHWVAGVEPYRAALVAHKQVA